MLSEVQKRTAQAIVNIFETGRVRGDYGRVTLSPGDAGHLTYGRSQTTLASGNLHLLIRTYCDNPRATYAKALGAFLGRLAAADLGLDRDLAFRRVLKDAGADPAMQEAQDHFFDMSYWMPAERAAVALAFTSALATAVIYDSHVHGSWSTLRDRTSGVRGEPAALGERAWVAAYVKERRGWLSAHPNPLLRRTAYRMDAFRLLIEAGNWALGIPMQVRGISIDRVSLGLSHSPVDGGAG